MGNLGNEGINKSKAFKQLEIMLSKHIGKFDLFLEVSKKYYINQTINRKKIGWLELSKFYLWEFDCSSKEIVGTWVL